jgi:inosose dehydratase
MTHFDLATAPVSFGIFGSPGGLSRRDSLAVVSAMAAAGFSGAELGPPGLFGSPEECVSLYSAHQLEVVGAYVSISLGGSDADFAGDVLAFERTCAELTASSGSPVVILADEGDDATRANPARSADHPVRWGTDQWDLAVARIDQFVHRIHDLGLTPSFHPHVGTYVENEREIELLLSRTDTGLTIDTGHLLLAGIEPLAALAAYGSRVNHIHIKDVHLSGIPSPEITHTCDLDDWWGDVASPLGSGDVDLVSFVAALAGSEHRWLVIEQDRDPAPARSLDGISRAELANRRWLEEVIALGLQPSLDDLTKSN